MKLTGQIIYEAWTRREHRYEVPPWDEASEKTRALYEAVADELNRDLAEHQTQPLVAAEKAALKVSFTASGKTLVEVCDILDRQVNTWLSNVRVTIRSTHVDTILMDGMIHQSVTMFVECPIDPGQDDEEDPALTQEAAAINAVEES